MRPLKNLTFEAIVGLLNQAFVKLPDRRAPERIRFSLRDTLMAGFSMMFLQHRSLLQFQERMKKKRGISNLETIFGVSEVPSDNQMREILDQVEVEALRRLLPIFFERIRRTGWAARYVTRVGEQCYYAVALDGTSYHNSSAISCHGCLRKQDHRTGQVRYSHEVVSATLVKSESRDVLPIDAEQVLNTDGEGKQDCEINASKRLVKRLRQEHPKMSMIILGDDLYSREPMVEALITNKQSYVLVCKPSSHKETFEWVESMEKLGEVIRGEWIEGPAAKRKSIKYRIVKRVPLKSGGAEIHNFFEVWEKDKDGKQIYHNSWITDLDVRPENISELMKIGRSRWKVENEHFNVIKNQGYELEHNYGHGKQNLSQVFYFLNLLAFVTHKILSMGDNLFQRAAATAPRRVLWEELRAFFNRLNFKDWRHLLRFFLEEVEISP